MTKELWRLGALDLAGRIAAKEISSREVIGAHLARIEAVNPAVNAVTVPLADQAMAAAAAADQAIAAGHSLGPLPHRQRVARCHAQPVEPDAHPRRFFGWRSGGISHRHVTARAGQRSGGLASDARPVHRSLWPEAVAWPGAVVERH